MRRKSVSRWTVCALVGAALLAGCSRSGKSGPLPGLRLVYAVDWSAEGEPSGTGAAQDRQLDALAGLRHALVARLATAGFTDERGHLRGRGREQQVVFRVLEAKQDDAARIKELLVPPLTFELRLASTEPYVDDELRSFLAADPLRADGLLVVTEQGDTYVMARGDTPDDERTLLAAALEAWRADPRVRDDPVRSALWERVRTGQAPEPRHVAVNPSEAETRWRTFLVEPEASMTCADIAQATQNFDPDDFQNQISVALDFTEEAKERLAQLTGRNVGRTALLVADGVVVFAGRIVEAITGGTMRLTFGSGMPDEVMRKVFPLVGLVAACTSGVRLKQPPLEEAWTSP